MMTRNSMRISRRAFLHTMTTAALGAAVKPDAMALSLADRFPDLRRHFVFEYYPWYATDPYRHWQAADRHPPADVASNYMPKLGAYDSRSRAVLERHAAWMTEAGVGSINLSWWGPD